MPPEIQALQPGDLDDLSRFLTAGFHTPPDADFAAPEVLRWKYLEPRGEDDNVPRSYLARDEGSRVVGHVGICRTYFESDRIPAGRTVTLHMIDWLGSAEQRAVGVSLMRRAHAQAPIQFGVGASEAARAVAKRGGYQLGDPVPMYQRVLRPSHWLRVSNLSLAERGSRLARDLAQEVLRRSRSSSGQIKLHQITSFDQAIAPIIEDAKHHAILTGRTPARLNHFLRFPRQAMSGWHLVASPQQLCGFALLNIVPQHGGQVRLGKIVDCLLEGTDIAIWSAAIQALTEELQRQEADVVQAFAAPPWVAKSLRQSGFVSRSTLEFNVRDRQRLLPEGIPFHLMPIEADYAYT